MNRLTITDMNFLKEYPNMITVKQLTEILNISQDKGYDMVKEGVFSHLKLGREIRIFKSSVESYIASNVA